MSATKVNEKQRLFNEANIKVNVQSAYWNIMK